MGVVANFLSVPADVWPAVVPRLRADGITVESEGFERGGWYATCVRGRCRVGLDYTAAEVGREVCVYCPELRCWRRPFGTRRLFRDVRRAVIAAGGRPERLPAPASRGP